MKLLTVEEVAEILRKSPHTINQWISNGSGCGGLFRKIGGSPLVLESDLEKWIKETPTVRHPNLASSSKQQIREQLSECLIQSVKHYEDSEMDLWESFGASDPSDPAFPEAMKVLDGYVATRLYHGGDIKRIESNFFADVEYES